MNLVITETKLGPGTKLQLIRGDITIEQVDAIVNAANSGLAHYGGVAGKISRAGGPVVQQESDVWVREHGPVPHDRPAYTSAGKLPSRYVIHAVGPVWGSGDEDRKLASAVTGALEVADQLKLSSIALPAISTGIFNYPLERAARVIPEAILDFTQQHPETSLHLIRLVLYDKQTVEAFKAAWRLLRLGEQS